jgi:hypothetical protein
VLFRSLPLGRLLGHGETKPFGAPLSRMSDGSLPSKEDSSAIARALVSSYRTLSLFAFPCAKLCATRHQQRNSRCRSKSTEEDVKCVQKGART